MKAPRKPDDDLKMNGAEFDRIMRGALQDSAPKKQPKKATRTKKPKGQVEK